MMKAGTETGSLMNHLMSNAKSPTPEVGMGVTILGWTDRHFLDVVRITCAGTITKVTRTQIHTTVDRTKRLDNNGMSESQEYEYTTDPNGRQDVFRMTKRGWRNAAGNGLLVGVRRAYHDYSF